MYPTMPRFDRSGQSHCAAQWSCYQEKSPPLKPQEDLNFHFLCCQRGESFVTVLRMATAKPKRAPAWNRPEVLDLIGLWGEESVLAQLRASKRNLDIYGKISQGMLEKEHKRDAQQCRVKIKELRQSYQKARKANSRSGSSPKTCRFYDEVHAVLGGNPTTVPPRSIDTSVRSQSMVSDEDSVDEEEEEAEESRVQESGVSIFPESQDRFLTPEQSRSTHDITNNPGDGTSDTSALDRPTRNATERLSQIRKRGKKTKR
ncbi:zinc finger and SCAN domain-containing protein 29-like [Emydura macquarii macquarii]|uniref:zinc finger and SCAN domain-containing protein 29-like n=1 Tax=Emydura macquarii macquarii TaxID=1129001 RepID=UPI00352AB929